MKRLAIFCGSNVGARESYRHATEELAKECATRNIELVYGGASVGLMGILADQLIKRGGRAIGVIPNDLVQREVAHASLSELHVVASMHERKAKMAQLADGFLALPGGFGTLDEFCEVLTWGQLGYHQKPCVLLNVDNYYDAFVKFTDHAVREGFIRASHRANLLVAPTVADAFHQLSQFRFRSTTKWA